MERSEGTPVNEAALEAMLRLTQSYRTRRIHLPQLVNDLSATLNGMHDVPADWRAHFAKAWGALEEVNALTLDAGDTTPRLEHERVVADALSRIEELVARARSTFGR
jgi:hypothetical protein